MGRGLVHRTRINGGWEGVWFTRLGCTYKEQNSMLCMFTAVSNITSTVLSRYVYCTNETMVLFIKILTISTD